MSIVLFMMFLFSGLMITLICRFTVFSEYEYTQGMYLGVHIPPEEKGSEIVRPFMEKEVKRQKIFQNINMLLSVLLCIPVFFWEAASVIIWTVWMCTYMIGYMFILNSAHRRLYKIKIQNGWINKNTQMIYVDTSLSADERSLKSNNIYHIITIASEFIMTIPFMINKSYSRSEGLIFALAAISISLICMILNIYVNKRNTTVYSEDTDINKAVMNLSRKYFNEGFISLSMCNAAAFLLFTILYMINREVSFMSMMLYITIQTLSTIFLVAAYLILIKKKKELLSSDMKPVYVDDDEYWKTGYYYNPNDNHILVKNRMFDGNYSFNLANRKARFICGGLYIVIIAAIVVTLVVLLPFSNVKMNVDISSEKMKVSAAGYKYQVDADNIENIELLDKLPGESFYRVNGGSTDTYDIGYYKGSDTGKCMLFIFDGYEPILKITGGGKIVFLNSKNEGEVQDWYEQIKKIRNDIDMKE